MDRRRFLLGASTAGAAATLCSPLSGGDKALGIPGPFRGKVVEVRHPGSVISGVYQREPVRAMVRRGMRELTGAPSSTEAWRYFFEPGDVVGIKVNPVGQPYLISAPEVMQTIIEGLEAAGVKRRDIVAFDRYRTMFLTGGFDKWLPEGVRWAAATNEVDALQLGMDGYDPDHYMEMALMMPNAPRDAHSRRSYVVKFLTKDVNKLINLGVLKQHQSAGVTIALKNLSHGLVNNVARSHISSTNNACGAFIPAVIDIPVIRNKVVLNVIDGIKGAYHGGPGNKVQKYIWERKSMYFATDPVAVDRIGLGVIDDQRARMGMPPIALATADNDSVFVRMQPEHIEIAGALGLGESDESKIELKTIKL
jgi:uncharacterized protein (DUF362 family)